MFLMICKENSKIFTCNDSYIKKTKKFTHYKKQNLESKINRITDILRRDDGINGAMMYNEQISWILFLKFLSDLEDAKADEALLIG
jgi:hypothetical protein